MQFSFSGRALPMTLRVCRSLLWVQAALTILAGVFVVLVTSLLGNTESIPFHGDNLTGSGAVALGAVYVAAGLAVAVLSIEIGRLASWARIPIVVLQVLLGALVLVRSFDLSVSLVINLALSGAIVALLFAPLSRRALVAAPQG
jgi:hypothetical protein